MPFVFKENCSIRQKLSRCGRLDIAKSGKLYQKIPVPIFVGIHSLNLSETTISSSNFIRLTTAAIHLRALKIERCGNITEDAIFRSKYTLQRLRSVDISFNPQFGILAIACICSYESIQDICFNGIKLTAEELLFLSKTFPRVANYGIDLRSNEIEGGDYFLDMLESADDLLFWDSRITWLDFYFLFVYRSVVTVSRLRGIARQILSDFNNLPSCQDFDESKINLLCSTRSVSKEHFPRIRFFCYFA